MIRFRDFIVENAPASPDEKGPFAIALKGKKGALDMDPDTKFKDWRSANKYGIQHHTGPHGEKWYEVIKHPGNKKK